jgi:hypothetical protein
LREADLLPKNPKRKIAEQATRQGGRRERRGRKKQQRGMYLGDEQEEMQ